MRSARQSVRPTIWILGCTAGLVACGTTPPGEFPAIAHGVIEGTVRGTAGQPLDSVNVTLVIPAQLSGQYAFGTPGMLSRADGSFSLSVEIYTAADPANLPDTVGLYVRGSAFPPKYPAPPGEEKISDSVLVATALGSPDISPPVTEAPITLPIP